MVYAKRAEIHPLPFTKKVKKKPPKPPPTNPKIRISELVLES